MYNAACLVIFPLSYPVPGIELNHCSMPLPTHSVYHPLYTNSLPPFARYYNSKSNVLSPKNDITRVLSRLNAYTTGTPTIHEIDKNK